MTISGAEFGYEGETVVRTASFEVRPAEFVVILGANGSGKTTLLRGLLGLLPLIRGTVARRPDLRVGYVPQRSLLDAVFPLSALDVVLMGTYAGMNRWKPMDRERRRSAEAALEAAHAGDLSHRRYAELSGGQRQRVLVARALVSRPHLLMLDEPTAGVDPETEKALLDTLSSLSRDDRISVWIVTHRLQAVIPYADRIARVIDGGVSLEEGTCSLS